MSSRQLLHPGTSEMSLEDKSIIIFIITYNLGCKKKKNCLKTNREINSQGRINGKIVGL